MIRYIPATPDLVVESIGELSTLLFNTVQDGASLGWDRSFTIEEARHYWQHDVFPLLGNDRLLICAFADDALAGCVQIERAHFPMSRHRAEVLKLIVGPQWRRRGIARGLMTAAESAALDMGIELFVLDTRPGVAAEPLYASMGYTKTGFIPKCIKGADGTYEDTVYYYKQLVVQLEHD